MNDQLTSSDTDSLDDLWQELYFAFEREDPVEDIAMIIKDDPRVLEHSFSQFQMTPLHMLVKMGLNNSLSATELLVQSSPQSLTIPDSSGNLPLHSACCNVESNLELIQRFVDFFPDSLRAKGEYKRTPFHMAVDNGLPVEIIHFLLERRPQVASEKDGMGATPMTMECRKDTPRLEVIELLSNACPILRQSLRDPESKIKAVVALSSVNNNFHMLFHQMRKNPHCLL